MLTTDSRHFRVIYVQLVSTKETNTRQVKPAKIVLMACGRLQGHASWQMVFQIVFAATDSALFHGDKSAQNVHLANFLRKSSPKIIIFSAFARFALLERIPTSHAARRAQCVLQGARLPLAVQALQAARANLILSK
jgi:hypothetical protein